MAKKDYVLANKRWLEDKAKEEGVKPLSNGIYYQGVESRQSAWSSTLTA